MIQYRSKTDLNLVRNRCKTDPKLIQYRCKIDPIYIQFKCKMCPICWCSFDPILIQDLVQIRSPKKWCRKCRRFLVQFTSRGMSFEPGGEEKIPTFEKKRNLGAILIQKSGAEDVLCTKYFPLGTMCRVTRKYVK